MSTLTLENWENARGERARRPRGAKPVARGQRLKSTAWLDGEMVWHDGALGWKTPGQIFVPDAAQIERAKSDLDKLPASETVQRRLEKWRLARKLGAVQARDLAHLCAVSRRRNPAALRKLAPLLVLESLGVSLPHSPARALGLAWPHSQSALESVVEDEMWPLQARQLAAFVAGANGGIESLPRPLRGVAALGARWQREANWLQTIAPVLMLETARLNDETARRLVQLSGCAALFAPDAAVLGQLLRAHGIEGGLQVGEQLAALELRWPQLPDFTPAESVESCQLAHQTRVEMRRAERDLRADWREIALAMALRAPATLALWGEFSQLLLDAAPDLVARVGGRNRRSKARNLLRSQTLDGAVFLAAMTLPLAQWLVRLGRQSLQSFDPALCLRLWCEVARRHLEQTPAPRLGRRVKREAGRQWFIALERGFEADAVPLLRVARAGGIEVALAAWERKHHRSLGYKYGCYARVPASSRVLLESWAAIARELPVCSFTPEEWTELWAPFEPSHARQIIAALRDAMRPLPPPSRAAVWENLVDLVPTRAQASAVWPHLPAVLRAVAPLLSQWEKRAVSDGIGLLCAVGEIGHDWGVPAALWPVLARVAAESCAAARALDADLPDPKIAYKIALFLSVAVSPSEAALPDEFRATLGVVAPSLTVDAEIWETALPGARAARGRPQLARALIHGLQIAPERALRALKYLAVLQREDRAQTRGAQTLDALETQAPTLAPSWDTALKTAPELESATREYAAWKARAGENTDPPPGVGKVLDWPRKWAREIEALESKLAAQPQAAPAQLQTRLDNLRARLSDEPKWRAQQALEIAQTLENAIPRAAFAALEGVLENAFRARLENLCGVLPSEFALNDDWINALLLGREVEFNRKWARALLRLEAAGQQNWREQLPGNTRFLADLSARGVDVNFYLSEFRRARGEFTLWLESEPLGILQMGNRFGTCLSRGGCNAFSSVANAIELNKRVVYARDKKGAIVARQLWAVSAGFELLGFHVYCNLPGEAHRAMTAHFAAHAREFARSCGLKLADTGEVASLVAPQWYDDGVRAWQKIETAHPKSRAIVK